MRAFLLSSFPIDPLLLIMMDLFQTILYHCFHGILMPAERSHSISGQRAGICIFLQISRGHMDACGAIDLVRVSSTLSLHASVASTQQWNPFGAACGDPTQSRVVFPPDDAATPSPTGPSQTTTGGRQGSVVLCGCGGRHRLHGHQPLRAHSPTCLARFFLLSRRHKWRRANAGLQK